MNVVNVIILSYKTITWMIWNEMKHFDFIIRHKTCLLYNQQIHGWSLTKWNTRYYNMIPKKCVFLIQQNKNGLSKMNWNWIFIEQIYTNIDSTTPSSINLSFNPFIYPASQPASQPIIPSPFYQCSFFHPFIQLWIQPSNHPSIYW